MFQFQAIIAFRRFALIAWNLFHQIFQSLDFRYEYEVICKGVVFPSRMNFGDLLLHSCDMGSELGFNLGGRMLLIMLTLRHCTTNS